jgi:diguanylate cyclase (GGDEF)-like protein
MFSKKPKTETSVELLDETNDIDSLRAQRVWRLSRVAWCTWFFFTGYFLWRWLTVSVTICVIEVIGIQLIISLHKGLSHHRRVMNLTLGACAIGILLVSLSDPSLHKTMLFYPVSILFASQLIGVREAFYWLIANIVAQTVFFLCIYGWADAFALNHFDEMVLTYGVAICTFFCCQQGEAFYRERTTGLIDISNLLRKKSQHLQMLATTDSLTGLLNRFQFLQELRERANNVVNENGKIALMLLDMDGFKEINDTLGHPVGDQALIEVSKRLKANVDEDTIVARLGGDEFCVIVPNVTSIEDVKALADRLYQSLKQQYVMQEVEFPLGASIGIAMCPEHTECPTELLAYSDTAMFCAKSNRTGYAVYDPEMTRQLVEYRGMQDKLSRALERNEFFLLYQPQVDLCTGQITAVEALLRWRHDGKVIPPVIFIPLLEKSREIVSVGRWIIEEVGRQFRAWNESGFRIGISINLSSIQFLDNSFEQYVVAPLLEMGDDVSAIDFEVTESMLVKDVDTASERLNRLKDLGATISIDDFGTGYSSLAYLRHLPLDRLKIDRTFVKDIPESDDGLIAKSVVALAKALGLKVLAEGVETITQLEFLKSIDCDEYQGFFMSPPVPPEKIMELASAPCVHAESESQALITSTAFA